MKYRYRDAPTQPHAEEDKTTNQKQRILACHPDRLIRDPQGTNIAETGKTATIQWNTIGKHEQGNVMQQRQAHLLQHFIDINLVGLDALLRLLLHIALDVALDFLLRLLHGLLLGLALTSLLLISLGRHVYRHLNYKAESRPMWSNPDSEQWELQIRQWSK